MKTKTMMLHNPELLHALLAHLTDALVAYIGYQIDSGAQVRIMLPTLHTSSTQKHLIVAHSSAVAELDR